MKEYEFRKVEIGTRLLADIFAETEELGRDGWQIVTVLNACYDPRDEENSKKEFLLLQREVTYE